MTISFNYREGAVFTPTEPHISEFFDRLTESDDGHWLWSGAKARKGYGIVWLRASESETSRLTGAHRYSFAIFVGPLPSHLTLDHNSDRCRRPDCVRPDHLEPETRPDNTRLENYARSYDEEDF